MWLSVAIGVALVCGLAAFFTGVSSDIVYGMPPIVVISATLLTFAATTGLALIPLATLAWRRHWFSLGGRLGYTLLALTTPLTAWWVWEWNVLGYQW